MSDLYFFSMGIGPSLVPHRGSLADLVMALPYVVMDEIPPRRILNDVLVRGRLDAGMSGWELWTMVDVFFLVVGLTAIAAALTGGRFGLFRRDLSLNGATDLLGVLSTILLAWLVLFDFPAGASRELGVYLALVAAVAIMTGAGDYGSLRGEPTFPRITADEAERPA